MPQLWADVLDSSRAMDWTTAGVEGGIPARTTICSTISSGASVSTVQSALNACPSGQVVKLSAGSYSWDDGLNIPSNVTLRGAGADQTFITWTTIGGNNCNSADAGICFIGDTVYYATYPDVAPGGSNAAAWTAGYAQGSTSITLTTVGSTGISNGGYIYLDQLNDTTIGTDYFTCDEYGTCSTEGNPQARPGPGHGTIRAQMQIVRVVSGCASPCVGAGPFTITISEPVRFPNISSGLTPGAWFPSFVVHDSGIENFSMNTDQIADSRYDRAGVQFDNAANVWVRGIRQTRTPGRRAMVSIQNCYHCSVLDNYFYSNAVGGSVTYAVETLGTTGCLIQNNITQQTGPFIIGTSTVGTVVSYNFTIHQPTDPADYNSSMIWEHDSGISFNLYEGNNGPGFVADTYHGNANMGTLFRNRLTGHDTGKAQNTTPVELWSLNRYHNIIGNVLGESGIQTVYEVNPGAAASGYIYSYGGGNGLADDSVVGTTVMRWGNYDVVNATVRWESSEVPSGISPYANAVPASHTLPSSFYLNAKPSWWPNSIPYPPIGPDVTGGNISGLGGHANLNPASNCYLNVMGGPADGSGSILSFNADTCYVAGGGGGGGGTPGPGTLVVTESTYFF